MLTDKLIFEGSLFTLKVIYVQEGIKQSTDVFIKKKVNEKVKQKVV